QQRRQCGHLVQAEVHGLVEGVLDVGRPLARELQHAGEDGLAGLFSKGLGVAQEFGGAFGVLGAVAHEDYAAAHAWPARPSAWRTAPATWPASSSSRRKYWAPISAARDSARPSRRPAVSVSMTTD